MALQDTLRALADPIRREILNLLKNGRLSAGDGKLGTFKKGTFVIANMAQATIIPVTIDGSYDILPKGCKCLHWSPVTLTFHAPVECKGRDSENVDRMMEETRVAIASALKNK